eukprot:438160-Rhodomonas_salina.1
MAEMVALERKRGETAPRGMGFPGITIAEGLEVRGEETSGTPVRAALHCIVLSLCLHTRIVRCWGLRERMRLRLVCKQWKEDVDERWAWNE